MTYHSRRLPACRKKDGFNMRVFLFIILLFIFITAVLILKASAPAEQGFILSPLSPEEIKQVQAIVFQNECGSRDEKLIAWNIGEDFISLGIGHFIWHPQGSEEIFEESFPKFIEFARKAQAEIPLWLDKDPVPACPWGSREDFLKSLSDSRLIELKKFLIKTKNLQAAFIVRRLEESVPLILKSAPQDTHGRITLQFRRVAATPAGVCALADYINFKGLGTSLSERYREKGWGLLQVLEEMRGEDEMPDALKEFSRAAEAVLEDRIRNSPPERNEQRWLAGWRNRVRSYAP